jgi:hypothetical protein
VDQTEDRASPSELRWLWISDEQWLVRPHTGLLIQRPVRPVPVVVSLVAGQRHAQVAGLLDHPRFNRVGGDPRCVGPSGVELDEGQHVEPAKQHRVDGEAGADRDR